MKKEENSPRKFDSLSDLHRVFGLSKPLHPLISVVYNTDNKIGFYKIPDSFVFNFYKISFSENLSEFRIQKKCDDVITNDNN